MTRIGLLFVAFAGAASAFLHPAAHLHKQRLFAEGFSVHSPDAAVNVSAPYGPVSAEKVRVPLDHFGGDEGSFENRYWVQDSDYEEGGPVFGKSGYHSIDMIYILTRCLSLRCWRRRC
jgi:hypothetical protein